MDKMYSLNEIALLPSDHPVDINSRSEVNPFTGNNKLPIFVSPMTCIIGPDNFKTFKDSKVTPILPRRIQLDVSENDWIAYSVGEFKKGINEGFRSNYALIDVANGHMQQLYDLVKEAKAKYPNLKVMIGNIANPKMYFYCCKAGVDFVRCSIGTGTGCSTSCLLGIHASLPWLLSEIEKERDYISTYTDLPLTKVIADGGINTIDKAIKCLALGADYVMMGSTFAQCEEACGREIIKNDIRYRQYYGMASERGQLDLSGEVTKQPEGIITKVPITTNLKNYCNTFEAALRSAMSYTGAKTLHEFQSNTQYMIQSEAEFNSYYK